MKKTTIGELNNYLKDQEIPGRSQMERFILVEIFQKKKVIPFEVAPFSRSYRNNNKQFSVPLVGIISARLHVERK